MSTTLPLAGVIGFPIAHSKSPKMHGLWLAQNGIKGHYVPLAVSPDDFERVLKLLPKMGFVGANVTIPHKVTALQLATHATDRARQIGAANTITFGENGEIYADNTDGTGLSQILSLSTQSGRRPQGHRWYWVRVAPRVLCCRPFWMMGHPKF